MQLKYNKMKFILGDRKFKKSCQSKKKNNFKQIKQKKRSSKIKTYSKVTRTPIKSSYRRKNRVIEEVKMRKTNSETSLKR